MLLSFSTPVPRVLRPTCALGPRRTPRDRPFDPLGSAEEATDESVPLEDRIVVRTAEAEETTVSGLVIPDTAKEKPQQGEVLAVGPGRRAETSGELVPLDIAVGDTVVYSKYGGTEITVDGEDLLILAGRDVLAKVQPAKGKKK